MAVVKPRHQNEKCIRIVGIIWNKKWRESQALFRQPMNCSTFAKWENARLFLRMKWTVNSLTHYSFHTMPGLFCGLEGRKGGTFIFGFLLTLGYDRRIRFAICRLGNFGRYYERHSLSRYPVWLCQSIPMKSSITSQDGNALLHFQTRQIHWHSESLIKHSSWQWIWQI